MTGLEKNVFCFNVYFVQGRLGTFRDLVFVILALSWVEVEWGGAFLVMLRLHAGLGVSNLAMICTNPTPFFVATQ